MTATHAIPLGYGNAASARRRYLVYIVAGVAIVAVALAINPLLDRLLYATSVYRLQQRCLAYQAPPEQVVYEEDPAAAARLMAAGGYRMFNRIAAFHVPADWHAFRGSYDCPDGTAFVHARNNAVGKTRLVAVDLIPEASGAVSLRASVIRPAGWSDRSGLEAARRTRGKPLFRIAATPGEFIRIFAGQIDVHDPSRFSIRFDRGNGDEFVDGVIEKEDGVILTHR